MFMFSNLLGNINIVKTHKKCLAFGTVINIDFRKNEIYEILFNYIVRFDLIITFLILHSFYVLFNVLI